MKLFQAIFGTLFGHEGGYLFQMERVQNDIENQDIFIIIDIIYRLTHSASELWGFTCTSLQTMNEKFQYRIRPPSAVLKNFEFIVSERVQVNPLIIQEQ